MGDTSDCLKLVFYHQKPAHKHVVTSVNFHVAKGKNTSIWQQVYHIDYDNSPVIRASKVKRKYVLGVF